ncbi:DNA-deoxyinosine glycosylase [Neisseriaceae bacterium TC5R-5]|nr:DNA-deoxyinosine glycosylase [Neisseriaceae bacterium TC5R-5]
MTESLELKSCFPPVFTSQTRVLILGSLPGDASLQAGQYYAHPRNQFWRLLQAILKQPLCQLDYHDRLQVLQQHKVGLWDVIASAQRQGSLDTAIRQQQNNDLKAWLSRLPALRVVAFNGATAAKAATQLRDLPLTCLTLPSSSPAHTLAFERKLLAWQQLMAYL